MTFSPSTKVLYYIVLYVLGRPLIIFLLHMYVWKYVLVISKFGIEVKFLAPISFITLITFISIDTLLYILLLFI